ncbi:MAG: hypothetical protein A2745_03175 [Candidatus Harrisonbacteria bacterium RIFCSPHIGHO2_01_FULL_44_13]|uniref:Uncharacterized protein n=1 Tax=Candidatus Harrisonbacteria bacterium RIFCSPLOWO2_01_FULL_44_18 TaxID=1798407 RepID=A0A1G1ZL80_9BACT|nr:MAG: hypothetical protein A2745_03175 [Candidatus Harrisonbacteria bacterium RIFCSPHIGHO2_01_FULL_44_13]OGY65393.1 MAG: hypothetical protein A3A16_03025 [Candidatus Harrisonbacteria bacterium RIFCSPLOWO2_01_FULL_44_18]
MLTDENNIIKQAQAGEAGAFGQLYDHYISPIYRFILLKVGNKHEAEDLCHEVFLSAWQNISGYIPRGFPFSSWLYQIARNSVIDYYRTKKNNLSLEGLDEDFVRVSSAAEDNLDFSLNIEKVTKAIYGLAEEQQEVILLRFVEDMSHKEIAAALNKSEGAIRLVQHRAIKNLKDILANNGQSTA